MAEKIIRWIVILGLLGLVIGLIVVFTQKNDEQPTQPDSEIIQEYKRKINDLTLNLNNVTIELNQTKDTLEVTLKQNSQDKETISLLTNQVETLTNQLTEYLSQIKYYEELLEAYLENDENTFKAEFYINDELQDIKIVNASVKVVFPNITIEQPYLFKGWSLDGETIIEDTTNYYIEEDTKFYAVVKFDTSRNNVVSYLNSNNYYAISYCESPAMIDNVLTGEIGANYNTLLNEVNVF